MNVSDAPYGAKEEARQVERSRYCAPDEIWVCGACGKTSDYDSYGIEGHHSYGWDESCMLHAFKVKRSDHDPSSRLSGATTESARVGEGE